MAEEEVAASLAPSDNKRKLEDLEPDAQTSEDPTDSNGDCKDTPADLEASDEAGAKRPRLDDQPDGSASKNGHEDENDDETVKENDDERILESSHSEAAQTQPEEVDEKANDGKSSDDPQQPSDQNSGDTLAQEKETHLPEGHQQGDDSTQQEESPSDSETITRRLDVPNNKVGVLIGKAGDTIRYLQYNSGAKIQITRDAESDPHSATRPVEIIGSLENIKKAEKLITAVIAEAEAGGSPALVARGLGASQATTVAEQIEMQVPNEKVGLIIGRGGETIKGLQTRSGARIQLIPQHLSEGGESKERTVRITGDKKQIEIAREMIKDVMSQNVRLSSFTGGYNQQGYRPRGPPGPHQWGPRGHHMAHPNSYDYQQRGPYSSHNPQYSSTYGGYHQPMGPRGWEQRPPPNMQGMHQHGRGYDYFGGQKGHSPGSGQHSGPPNASGPPHSSMGPPHSHSNYNYGQHQGTDYGHPVPYSQSANPQQSYSHGYDDHSQHYGSSQMYQHTGAPTGYSQQQQPPPQQYSKPPPYGMPSQGPPQPYGPPRPNPDVPYQASAPAQSYGQSIPPQQSYQYASTSSTQQPYSQYGSAPAAEGYNQAPPASGSTYSQQGAQPVASYGQPGAQPAAPVTSYAQQGPTLGYGQYSAQVYTEQTAANTAGYGYQGSQDPAYGAATASAAYAAPPAGQQVYAAQATTQAQQGYEQSAQPAGSYVVQQSTSVGYGAKTVSPQPQPQPQPQPGFAQYDSSQMYAAPH